MATTQLATQPKQTGIASYLGGDAVKKNIAGVVGEKNITRFITSVVSAVQANPALARCSNSSILSAALLGEALQLTPSPQLGQFYIVPYKNKKKVGNQWVDVEEAQYQLGAKGYIQLAIRSGQYKSIVVSDVREGELESFNPITEDITLSPIQDPAVREGTPVIGYYAMFRLVNGFEKVLFRSVESIQAHAKQYSRGYRYDLESGKKTSPWSTNFDAMARKTMIRQLISKWGIMSVEMQQAYTNDMAVIDEDGTARYVDNPQNTPVEVVVQEDIEKNANTVDFEEEVVVEPEPAPAPAKKTRAKKTDAPAPPADPNITEVPINKPEESVKAEHASAIEIEVETDDGPEWA